MMAVHHASAGDARQEFVEWSTSDENYDAEADSIGRRWDSLHAGRNDGVTYRTLNKILRDHGASDAQVANEVPDDDFPDDIEQDLDFDTPAGGEEFDFDTPAEKRKSKLYTETKLPELLDFAEVCIVEAGAPVYQMGGRLVHPVRAEKDTEDSESIRRKAGALDDRGHKPAPLPRVHDRACAVSQARQRPRHSQAEAEGFPGNDGFSCALPRPR